MQTVDLFTMLKLMFRTLYKENNNPDIGVAYTEEACRTNRKTQKENQVKTEQ